MIVRLFLENIHFLEDHGNDCAKYTRLFCTQEIDARFNMLKSMMLTGKVLSLTYLSPIKLDKVLYTMEQL